MDCHQHHQRCAAFGRLVFVISCAFLIPVVVTVLCLLFFSVELEKSAINDLQWETLVTGLAALVAAKWTVSKIGEQIAESRRQAEMQRQQNLVAAKIKMSGALLEIQEYSKDAFAYCMACVFEIESKNISEYKGKLLPHCNDPLFAPIIDVATLTDHTDNTEMIYRLFRNIQVSVGGLKELPHPPLNEYCEKYQEIAWLLHGEIIPVYCIVQALVDCFQTQQMAFQTADIILLPPDHNRIGASFLGLTEEWKRRNNTYPDFPDVFKQKIRDEFNLDNVSSGFPDPFQLNSNRAS